MKQNNFILTDGRWRGAFGIGRLSAEVLKRLQHTDILTEGPQPLAIQNLIWLPYQLQKKKSNYSVFYSPGFNPVSYSPIPYVFTICDLIHLHFPGNHKLAKQIYYDYVIKPSTRRAAKIITISEFSKKTILEWTGLPDDKVVVVDCGVSDTLSAQGAKHAPGYSYLLHVGNTKSHKNVERLLQAFAQADIDPSIRLILTGTLTPSLQEVIQQHQLKERVVFSGKLSENQLAEYYRGAIAVVFPSLYEGFGLPVLEAMACGIPALTSNVTSLPEVAENAAILVDPYELDSITHGIETIVKNESLRQQLVLKGFERIKRYSWDNTAAAIQRVLDEYKP